MAMTTLMMVLGYGSRILFCGDGINDLNAAGI